MRRGYLLGVLLLVVCISGRDLGARQSGSDPILGREFRNAAYPPLRTGLEPRAFAEPEKTPSKR